MRKATNCIKICIEIATLLVLAITLYYVYKYWDETQQMKYEMILQNAISMQSQLINKTPLIDIYIERDKDSEETWNTFIENRGNGPAYNVLVIRTIDNAKVKQKLISGGGQVDLMGKTVNYSILEAGGKRNFIREYGRSLDNMIFNVTLSDIFGEIRKYKFEGTRMEPLTVRLYPKFKK